MILRFQFMILFCYFHYLILVLQFLFFTLFLFSFTVAANFLLFSLPVFLFTVGAPNSWNIPALFHLPPYTVDNAIWRTDCTSPITFYTKWLNSTGDCAPANLGPNF